MVLSFYLWSEVFDQSVGLVLCSVLCDLMEWDLVNKSRTVLVDLFYSSELIFLNQSIILRACVDEVDNLMFMLPASEAKGSNHFWICSIGWTNIMLIVKLFVKTSKRLGQYCFCRYHSRLYFCLGMPLSTYFWF